MIKYCGFLSDIPNVICCGGGKGCRESNFRNWTTKICLLSMLIIPKFYFLNCIPRYLLAFFLFLSILLIDSIRAKEQFGPLSSLAILVYMQYKILLYPFCILLTLQLSICLPFGDNNLYIITYKRT